MSHDPLHQSHAPEYIAEFLGTAALVFFGLSAVVFNFSKDLPMSHWIPDPGTRRLLTGLCFAGTGSLVAISPLGRLSGGHINPAVSLAFWLSGKMRLDDFLSYVVAQMLGGIMGAALLVGVWHGYAEGVHNGMSVPGNGWSPGCAFIFEAALTGLMVLMIFIFVSSRRLMRWTPLMNWFLIAGMVWLEAPISGTSLNPARSIGPALMTGEWGDQWIYVVAPLLGAMTGLFIFTAATPEGRRVLTGKLFSVPHYRTVFKQAAVRPGLAPVLGEAHGCAAAPATPKNLRSDVLPVA